MIHPSYFELMELVNKDVKEGEKPVITSRYSIVLGTAKRARQLVAADRTEYKGHEEKPLSIAVDELMNGDYHITRSAGTPEEAEEEYPEMTEDEIGGEEEIIAEESDPDETGSEEGEDE